MKTADQKKYDEYVNTPGKLSMTKFRTEFPFNINRGLSGFDIDSLLDKKYYSLDFDVFLSSKGVNLQRALVWTLEQKRQLIYSILKGIYIPPITAVQHHEKKQNETMRTLFIIDGKQRLTTVISFVRGEFGILYEEKEYFFIDLAEQAKRTVNDCFRFDIAYSYWDRPVTDNQMIAWFEMINFAGTMQDVKHMEKLKKLL